MGEGPCFGLFRASLHEEVWGLPHFRVLIVTITPYCRDRLRAVLWDIGLTPNMFLFTIWKEVLAETVATEPIWVKAHSESPVSLLD